MLKPYTDKIETIKNEIYEMGEIITHANKVSLSALKENDLSMLKDISLSIKKISIKSNEIDNLIVATLALYSPEARDLREMVSFLKITNELTRASTYSKNFIKTFKKSFTDELDKHTILEFAIPLLKSSNQALQISLDMIKETDDKVIEEMYNKVSVEDSKTSDLYSMVEKNILKLISKKIELSRDYFEVLSSLRKLEKISGRASSIANLLLFAEVGGEIGQS
ncbi:MAG: PhoU family transcriptional regulator [Arcobacter sp.]|nr:MAG: PhoU family transcriptional regulator [Arcobacter sp.]